MLYRKRFMSHSLERLRRHATIAFTPILSLSKALTSFPPFVSPQSNSTRLVAIATPLSACTIISRRCRSLIGRHSRISLSQILHNAFSHLLQLTSGYFSHRIYRPVQQCLQPRSRQLRYRGRNSISFPARRPCEAVRRKSTIISKCIDLLHHADAVSGHSLLSLAPRQIIEASGAI